MLRVSRREKNIAKAWRRADFLISFHRGSLNNSGSLLSGIDTLVMEVNEAQGTLDNDISYETRAGRGN